MRIKAVGKVTSNITIHNLEGGITISVAQLITSIQKKKTLMALYMVPIEGPYIVRAVKFKILLIMLMAY